MSNESADKYYITRAFELAALGRGQVEPNPEVGAVLVKDGKIVGEGFHEIFGGPHAEINAISNAGEAAQGATLYVTLEPCNHFGKTPPCTDAIIRAGIVEVIYAATDSNTVAGGGAERLATAGVSVRLLNR